MWRLLTVDFTDPDKPKLEVARPGSPSFPFDQLSGGAREQVAAAVRLATAESSGNTKLRESLGWESARYDSVKETLVGRGIIQTGKGRGGSVKLPE
jgi:hypothetical protein